MFADAHLDDRNRSDRKLAAPRAAPRSASHSIELVQTRHPWHPGLGCRKGYPRFGTFHEEAEGGDDDLDDPDEDDGLYQDGDIYYPSADEGEDAKEGEMGHEADGGESAPYEHDWVTLQQAFHAFAKGKGTGRRPGKGHGRGGPSASSGTHAVTSGPRKTGRCKNYGLMSHWGGDPECLEGWPVVFNLSRRHQRPSSPQPCRITRRMRTRSQKVVSDATWPRMRKALWMDPQALPPEPRVLQGF